MGWDEVLGGEPAKVRGDDEDVCSGGYAAIRIMGTPQVGPGLMGLRKERRTVQQSGVFLSLVD